MYLPRSSVVWSFEVYFADGWMDGVVSLGIML